MIGELDGAEGPLFVCTFVANEVRCERGDVMEDAFSAIGRDRAKFLCGSGVNEDGPSHDAVELR